MYCKYCGKQIPDNAKFCPSCGKQINMTASETNAGAGRTASQRNESSASGAADMQKFLSIIGPQPSFTYGSYFVWGGCLIAFISLYLSFYREIVINEYSLRFIDMDHSAWIIVLLVAVAVLNIFKLYVGDIIGGGIVAIIIWNYVANAREALGVVDSIGGMFGMEESVTEAVVSYGAGLYLMIVGLLILLGGAVYGLVKTVQAHRND